VPFDKQTQAVCTAKYLHGACMCVCAFVICVSASTKVQIHAPRTTHRVVIFLFLQYVHIVTLCTTARPAANTANVCMHTCQPTHISACTCWREKAEKKKKHPAFQLQTTSGAFTSTQLCKHVAMNDVAPIYQM